MASRIQTRAVILTRIGGTLVDVDLAPRPLKANGAVAAERARSVDARTTVFTEGIPDCTHTHHIRVMSNLQYQPSFSQDFKSETVNTIYHITILET